MSSLRAKQNMEMLDVFKNINSQVVGLQNKQIQVFPESLAPKSQRDLGAEVNTDKAIEQLNRTVEQKLGALELIINNLHAEPAVITNVRGLSRAEFRGAVLQAEQIVISTGDVVPLYNSIVRFFQTPGINRDSQNIIRVKIQELQPNLEAMMYGLNQLVDWLFENREIIPTIGLSILNFLRTLSVFTLIKQQVDSGVLEPISVDNVARSFKNVLDDLPSNKLAILKKYAPRGELTSSSVRNIPEFDILNRDERVRQIADEVGINPNVLLPNVRDMNRSQFERFVTQLNNEKASMSQESIRELQALEQEIQNVIGMIHSLNYTIIENTAKMMILEKQNKELDDPLLMNVDEKEVERQSLDIPDEPDVGIEPTRADFSEGKDGDEEFEEALSKFIADLRESEEVQIERERRMLYNQGLLDRAINDVSERKEIMERHQKTIERLVEENEKYEVKKQALVQRAKNIQARGQSLDRFSQTVKAIVDAYDMKPMNIQNVEESQRLLAEERQRRGMEEEKKGEGRPKDIDTRGLAGIRKNYGFHSDSDSDSDSDEGNELDFDDAKNESYYTRPK